MRRAIQSLVSRQSVLAQIQPPFMINLVNPYVCRNCRRYLSGGWLPREAVVVTAAGGRGGRRFQQQQREVHTPARYPKIDWEGFQKVSNGRKGRKGQNKGKKLEDEGGGEGDMDRGRIQLQEVILSFEEWQYINDNTASFSQLRDESSVATQDSLGGKLVDNPSFIASTKLWHILLIFRRRLYEDAGVKEIWDGMKLRGIDLPTEGPSADEFWGIFLRSALRDDAFLQEIWEYVQDLDSRGKGKRAWSGIYDTIVGHFLLTDPLKARPWHYSLYPRHASKSLPGLFAATLQQRLDVHLQLREIHATTKKPAGIYSTMIPPLCIMGLHAEAVRWHQHCVSFADLPEDTSAADELIKWMAKYRNLNELHQLLYSFVETGVKIAESSLVTIIVARPDKMEALRFILARSNEFDTTAMGDVFWAHVVNQRNLERVDIYRYLETFGPGLVVGQETVEAVMKRFELPENKTLWLLTEIGITFRKGNLTPEDQTPESPTQKNLHWDPGAVERGPRTVEELEALLQEHLAAKDWGKFDSVLRFPLPGPTNTSVHNIILRSDLSRGRLQEALHRIEYMRMHSVTISTPSLHLMIATILRPRRHDIYPDTWPWYVKDDIFLVIGILFSLLRSGVTKVEPHLWKEIFKRLGMTRRLLDIEALATGLVEWYHPTRSISTRRRFARGTVTPSARTTSATTVAEVVAQDTPLSSTQVRLVEVPDLSRENPLRKLFPKDFFMAVVEWGFLTFRPYSPTDTPLIPPPPPPRIRNLPKKYREFAGCVPLFTWGIEFAKRLQNLGVFVDPRVLTRAISVRLKPIFHVPHGMRTPKRVNQMSACMMNYLTLEEVVNIAEKAWGGKLYERKGWKSKVIPRKITCECGKEKFEVEDGEKQIIERHKKDTAMRNEVLGSGVPEVKMRSREVRNMNKLKKRKKRKV